MKCTTNIETTLTHAEYDSLITALNTVSNICDGFKSHGAMNHDFAKLTDKTYGNLLQMIDEMVEYGWFNGMSEEDYLNMSFPSDYIAPEEINA